jgi:hypothetical protein
MCGVDNQQLAVDYQHKKAVTGATAGKCEVDFILLNPSISNNDRRQLAVDPASIMPQSSSKSFCV